MKRELAKYKKPVSGVMGLFNFSTRFQQFSLLAGVLLTISFLFYMPMRKNNNRLFFGGLDIIRNRFSLSGFQISAESTPIILLWTTLYGKSDWLPSPRSLGCPLDCEVTSNRELLQKSDAIIFHLRSMNTSDLPPWNLAQKWVLYNREAPPHSSVDIIRALRKKIHWTATYKRDSDFYTPYGMVVPANVTQLSTDYSSSKNKSHLVCWIVSNCQTSSHRESYVRILGHHVPIVIYGRCGLKDCPEVNAQSCYEYISETCKFYLSFENSICTDYVTEKLFYALKTDMVPIVMGGANYSDILPEHSYINTMDFPSPKALANYLLELNRDHEKFKAYHAWKSKYKVLNFNFKWACEICQRLHNDSGSAVTNCKNLLSWWFYPKCQSWTNVIKYY